MIAMIRFDDALLMKKELAYGLLCLQGEDVSRIGYSTYHEKTKLTKVSSGQYFVDELSSVEDKEGLYLLREGKEPQSVSSYSIYKRSDEDPSNYCWISDGPHMVNLKHFALNCPVPFRIIKTLMPDEILTTDNLVEIIQVVEHKINKLQRLVEDMPTDINLKCNVMTGGLMTTFNDVMLKEDACTDALQEALSGGWHIMAVCVQPDQRRPDYILGRFNPDLDRKYDSKRAER